MKILSIVGHDILEMNQLRMFSKLGFTVQTTGTFADPENPDPLKTHLAPLEGMNTDRSLVDHFFQLNPSALQFPKPLNLDDSFVSKFDVVIVSWLNDAANPLLRKKPVFYQTLGQSDAARESFIRRCREVGIKIVRMSKKEENFPNYSGADFLIDLNVDTDRFSLWEGEEEFILTINSLFSHRGPVCNAAEYLQVTDGLPRRLFGTGNDANKADYIKGTISEMDKVSVMRKARLFFSLGTKPCPCVLSFKEAMSLGMPVVTWGPKLGGPTFGAHEFIENEVNGFYSDDLMFLRKCCEMLLKDSGLAKKVGKRARKIALENFSDEVIGQKWVEAFKEAI